MYSPQNFRETERLLPHNVMQQNETKRIFFSPKFDFRTKANRKEILYMSYFSQRLCLTLTAGPNLQHSNLKKRLLQKFVMPIT
jgi:hypothetical protein